MIGTLLEGITNYREKMYRSHPGERLQTKNEAVEFINQRGFILFHPAKGIDFPSLWVARAGDRAVPNEHDDPGHVTWSWKDELLGQRKCYYGRLLGQKMSFVSMDMLPTFFRLSRNIEFENDFLLLYKKGEMSYEAKRVYECLLDNGPLDTLALRKITGLSGKENQYRYTKTLSWLQTELMIMPVGVAEVGRWNYGFVLDIVPRYIDDLADRSLSISRTVAMERILQSLVNSLGATSERNVRKILRWDPRQTQNTILRLSENGFLTKDFKVEGIEEPQLVLSKLLI